VRRLMRVIKDKINEAGSSMCRTLPLSWASAMLFGSLLSVKSSRLFTDANSVCLSYIKETENGNKK